jgi:hypothetical protein
MRPSDKIEKLIKDVNIQTNVQTDEAVLDDVLNTFVKSKKEKSAGHQPKIWRIIMKSRITRLSTAAVFLMGLWVVIYTFVGDGTTSAFAQMTENMKIMPWLHAEMVGMSAGKPDRLEAWISFGSQVSVSKRPSGQVTYRSKSTNYEYDPGTQTITVSYVDDSEFADIGSVWSYWDAMMKMFREAGGQIIQESSEHEGRKATIYKVKCSPFGSPMEIEMVVDAKLDLPVYLNQKQFGLNGEVTAEANARIDYPEKGPVDIYEAGAAKSAKIINNLPGPEIPQLLEMYRSHRESAPSDYVAVVIDNWFEKKLNTFLTYGASVIYRNGRLQRVDDYIVPQTKQRDWQDIRLKLQKEMGNTFESQISWWKQNGLISSVNLYDGKFQYQLKKDNDKWVAEPKRYMPMGDLRADNDLADLGWGVHFLSPFTGGSPFTIVEDEYSKKHNLVCLESAAQGRTTKENNQQTWAISPKMVRCYLNPERDYICQRFEQNELFEAPWQKDKSWLESVEKNNIRKQWADNTIREVVEFGQIDDGRWYPKVIKTWNPIKIDEKSRMKRILLRTNPKFPDGIFLPKNLPETND